MRGFTRTVAVEVGSRGINVNCVASGIVGGDRMDRLCQEKARKRGWRPEQVHQEYVQEMALRRVTTAEDVAGAVCFHRDPGDRGDPRDPASRARARG
ncbi:MAG: SDR family oxidoreductase [Candidatus Rokuibacteriota bacterium]